MAVTPEQIKARLKAKYPKANLSQKRIDAIAAKLAPKPADGATDEDIDGVLENANDFMSFEDIAKEDDRVRTLEANQKPKTDPPAPEPNPQPQPQPNPVPAPANDAPEWAKAMMKQIQDQGTLITELQTGKVTETKRASAADLFAKSEVLKGLKDDLKPNWLGRINIDSETPLEEQVTALETEFTALAQSFADNKGYSGAPPTGTPPKPDDKLVSDVVDSIV